MLSFKDHKRIAGTSNTVSKTRRENSHFIMDQTFAEDSAYRYCYIYDYEHDDQPQLAMGMDYSSTTKTGIDTKYLVTRYGSLEKDQVEYHIMFRRGQDPLPYYNDSFGRNAEFPIGLYIDIPDENDVYRKWMILSRDMEPDYIKYSVLPCNYYYHWVKNGKTRKMWGIARLRSSYNSGLWTSYRTTSVENQDQMFLPRNNITNELFYNDRIIISDLIKEPITWLISKVENVHPFGVNKFTLAQDKFNEETDYVNYETGEMYADYYKYPINDNEESNFSIQYVGELNIKVHGSKRLINVSCENSDIDINDVNWSFTINSNDVSNLIEYKMENSSTASIKFLGDESYISDELTICAKHGTLSDAIKIVIAAL